MTNKPYGPLRFCIFTTIALLAWLLSPPVAVLLMSGLGLLAYAKAWRGGLRRSKCVLGDVRLVVGYLGLAFVGAAVALSFRLAHLLG